jgi:glycine betaine/choline ABC-type transport system substrate-binding protein
VHQTRSPGWDRLAPLSKELTTDTMTDLNKKISSDGEPADKIAEDFLKEKGFLK